ncbi:MAG: hypothetical protein HY017_09165 [Betaproteobacteria bacterium]|nr:hypothetical protein [Betaproteobacteria bacterium]
MPAAHRSLIVLRAGAGSAAPYTYDGRPFIRIGSTTRRMKREEYERLLLARLHARHRWETLPATGWSIADMDADEIRLARFRGVTKSEFIDNRQFQGHAFALLRQADAFFDMHLPVASRIVSGRKRREDRPQYPPEALREALVNALCHRDYTEAGASVGVAIFDDRIEVWSWGRLPGDLTPEKLRIDHPSVRRNELQSPMRSTGGATSRIGGAARRRSSGCARRRSFRNRISWKDPVR